MVAGQPSVDGGVDDAVQAHCERVDVLHLPVLALRDERAQLQVLVLDHLDGVLQRAHLHLYSGDGGEGEGEEVPPSEITI